MRFQKKTRKWSAAGSPRNHRALHPRRSGILRSKCSAEPGGDVLAIRQDFGEADESPAPGYFGALAEGLELAASAASDDLVAVQTLKGRLGHDNMREWSAEDLDDLGTATLVTADPAVVTDSELLPAPMRDEVEQIGVVASGQVSS